MNPQEQLIRPAELAALLSDLQSKKRWPGWNRFLLSTSLTLALIALTLVQSNPIAFVLLGIVAGFAYASMMILTHDAIHHTLTGSRFWDELIPRLMSWPMLWPHGTYSAIHLIHHKLNGRDELDPERCHLTAEEYRRAGSIRKLIARNQLLFRVLVAGGFGMLFNLVARAREVAPRSRRVRRELRRDALGVLITTTVVFGLAAFFDLGLKAAVLWIILERTVGGVQQFRAHLEHYGLWTLQTNFLESQIYNCRNIKTNFVTSQFFNGLNYHSVHHAFPNIPFYSLKEAHERIRSYCNEKGAPPMVEEEGYAKVAFSIIKKPTFVKPFRDQIKQQTQTSHQPLSEPGPADTVH